MKKLVVMLLTAVIAVSAVTGCGTSGNQPEESTAGPESGAADEGEAVPEETEADHTEVSETERAAEEEIISEGTVYNVFCLGEDFKNRVQDYYPEYVITGEDAGMIGETKVQWHLYTDAQEYREALDVYGQAEDEYPKDAGIRYASQMSLMMKLGYDIRDVEKVWSLAEEAGVTDDDNAYRLIRERMDTYESDKEEHDETETDDDTAFYPGGGDLPV